MSDAAFDALQLLRREAAWLGDESLGVCVVGSWALAIACRNAGADGPNPVDLDLAWALDHDAGTQLLQRHGVFVPTTTGNVDRGTLAMKLAGRRIEITTFRAGDADAPLAERIAADLAERDMTIGAIAVELASGRMHDPHSGLEHYRARRIEPVGDPAQRVREHGIRWLRYFRKAHELGFALAASIRSLRRELDPALLLDLPPEAIALELRAILGKCASPGRCLLDLFEAGVLATISPELAAQFDGRPAGPQRWHPEVSQALHVVLALEWARDTAADLDERERLAVMFAVLCHDLGKNDTPPAEWPHHRGHEDAGIPHIDRLVKRWPGFVDQQAATLARHVAALHLEIRDFDQLRPGTLAELYDRWFRASDYPVEAFAIAVAADVAGRLGHAQDGAGVRDQVSRDIGLLRRACGSVDARSLKQRFGDDLDGFRRALHEARARAIADARRPG